MPQRKQEILGVELGEGQARLAIVSPASGSVSLARTVTWTDPQDALSRLRAAVADVPPEIQMAVSVHDRQVRSRLIDLPALKKSDIDLALTSRLRKYLPYRADEWSLFPREAKIAALDPERHAYFITIAATAGIKGVVRIMEPFAARWTSRLLEVPARSLQRWLQWERPAIGEGVHVGAHFFNDYVLMWACSEGALIMARRIEWMASAAALDDPTTLRELVSQLRATVAWLRLRTLPCEIVPVDIYLSGTHAMHPAILDAVARDIGLPVVTVTDPRLPPGGSEVAYGLSLVSIEEKG